MNEEIAEYLKNAREQELLKRGLYEIKYFDSKEVTKEMKKELKYDTSQYKYYKKIPYEVTDEEYNEILKIPIYPNKKEPILTSTFYLIGVLIFFFGAIGGYTLGQPSGLVCDFNWQLTWTVWLCTLFSGMVFLGFGKVIDLLNEIKYK